MLFRSDRPPLTLIACAGPRGKAKYRPSQTFADLVGWGRRPRSLAFLLAIGCSLDDLQDE